MVKSFLTIFGQDRRSAGDDDVWNDRRHDERDLCEIEAMLFVACAPDAQQCTITDISERGARLKIDPTLELTDRFTLAVPVMADCHHARAVELRWRDGEHAGVAFFM